MQDRAGKPNQRAGPRGPARFVCHIALVTERCNEASGEGKILYCISRSQTFILLTLVLTGHGPVSIIKAFKELNFYSCRHFRFQRLPLLVSWLKNSCHGFPSLTRKTDSAVWCGYFWLAKTRTAMLWKQECSLLLLK